MGLDIQLYLFAVILEMPVGLSHLALRDRNKNLTSPSLTLRALGDLGAFLHPYARLLCSSQPHLQLLRLPSYFEQLRDGVHEALEVMVAHLLDLAVVVTDPHVQLLHEGAMLVTVIHRPARGEKTAALKKWYYIYIYSFLCILSWYNAIQKILKERKRRNKTGGVWKSSCCAYNVCPLGGGAASSPQGCDQPGFITRGSSTKIALLKGNSTAYDTEN